METPIWLLGTGFIFIVVFGGLSMLRKEGLSLRFAVEAIVITLLVTAIAWLTSAPIHPAIFLLALYFVTMRVRLMVDVGNLFARRRSFHTAEMCYRLGGSLWPDATNRLILAINLATLRLQQGQLDEAITGLKEVIKQADQGFLGIRYESAAHYNLAVAYQRKGQTAQAVTEFNTTLDVWPSSEYARAAGAALARHRKVQAGETREES